MEKLSLSAVYFERLKEDAIKEKKRPELLDIYNFAKSSYTELSNVTHGFGGANRILSMASAEAEKEQRMLNQIFGTNLSFDLRAPGAIKMITEAINDAFHFRSIYERNKALLLSEDFNKQKGVYSYFHTYFNQALREDLDNIMESIKGKMEADHSLSAGDAALLVFKEFTPKMVNSAITKMFEANTELKTMDQSHINAYQEILSFINKFPSENILTQQLAKAWGLDKAALEFKEAFSQQRRKPKAATMDRARRAAEREVSKSMHSKGGISLEAVIDQCLAITANGLNTKNSVASVHTGAGYAKARPDNVFSFNMNSSLVDEAFNNIASEQTTREKAVTELTKLGDKLNQVKDGFIVYVNAKNYSIGNDFKGMSAGTAWNLDQIGSLLGNVVGDIEQLTYNLLQTGSGAIAGGDTKGASELLAEGIAYYLFDDYNTIGNSGGNGIHVMNLQGMLIPLSAFLFALGTAIQDVESSPSGYVKVSISSPSVDDSDENSYWMENWESQYENSLRNTKISIHFMSNFINFVAGYL